MDRLWTDYRQTMDRLWTDCGQTVDRLWTDYGQTMDRLWRDVINVGDHNVLGTSDCKYVHIIYM